MASAEKRGNGPTPWRARYLKPDGTIGSEPGFATRKKAITWGNDQEAAIRARKWVDPKDGKTTMDAYFATWLPAQDVSDDTAEDYERAYRVHISSRWGSRPVSSINIFDVQTLEKDLRARRKQSTVAVVVGVLRMMMADAVTARMIDFSPVLPKNRRGRRVESDMREGVSVPVPTVLEIMSRLALSDALMWLIVVFTGMRWGEVAGMRRQFLTLDPDGDDDAAPGYYVIDPDVGALKERGPKAERYFGPPKFGKGRTVELPAFLVRLLIQYCATFPVERDLLFVNRAGVAHNHANFREHRWRPACDGWEARPARGTWPAREAASAVALGLHWHDGRHTHKTMLADLGIEQRARDERLGHTSRGMDAVYIHVTPKMRREILEKLESLWRQYYPQEVDLPNLPHSINRRGPGTVRAENSSR